MKKSEIRACLKAQRNITAYELISTKKDSRELFYVLDHLEINRAVKVNSDVIRVYVADGKTTGTSTVTVTAADDSKTLARKLKNAVKQAKAARNRYYPLAEKTVNIRKLSKKKADLNEVAMKVAEAVLKADVYENGWINSTEIFVSAVRKEFVNSNGTDHITDGFKIEVECIPTWSSGKEEFELYKFYESDRLDCDQITKEVNEILNLAKARSEAKTLKQVKLPKDIKVLVKNDMLETIIGNLVYDISYRNVYMKENHYNKGDKVSDNLFTVTLKPSVSGCAASALYDDNGIVLKALPVIKDGIVKANHGDQRFGYYLGEKKISGKLPVTELKAEGSTYEKEKHLIIENFSAPQLEENSGYWGGEVRLARYFDGKKYIPLTGFSIAGQIYDDLKKVEFSKEQTLMSSYKGPKYMIFKGIKIS